MKINIKSILNESKINELKNLLGSTLYKVIVGGNYDIHGILNGNSYVGNQISLSFKTTLGKRSISVFSKLEEKDDFGEYDRMFVKLYAYGEEPFLEDKDLLLRNRGLLILEVPKLFILKRIDIYGINFDGFLEIDEDFPDESTLLNANIDLLLKLNSEAGEFIVCYLKSGKTRFDWHNNVESFNAFIKNSQKYWGEDRALKLRHSLIAKT